MLAGSGQIPPTAIPHRQLHIPAEFSDRLRELAKEGRGAIEINRPQGAVTIGSATGGGNTSCRSPGRHRPDCPAN